MDPIFACFVVGVLNVFETQYRCVYLIKEHGFILLFQTTYEHF